jgi:hypothetical protein
MRHLSMPSSSAPDSARLTRTRCLLLCIALSAGCAKPDYGEPSTEAGTHDPAAASRQGDAAELDGSSDGAATIDSESAAWPSEAGGARDALMASGDESDAASSADAATPGATWLDRVLGRYGMRIWAYSYDGALTTLSDGTFLAEIKRDGAEYQMVTTRCRSLAVNSVARLAIPRPEQLGTKRHRIIPSDATFSTQVIDAAEAFDTALPPECSGKLGELVPKRAHQDWLASTCRCGGELAPARDDCRLLDPDDDGQPGITFAFSSVTGSRYDLYSVSIDESRIVDVSMQTDGTMRGLFQGKSAAIQYGCEPANCADLSGPIAWCPADKYTLVQLSPLAAGTAPPDGWSCEAINAREGELFPELPPPYPSSCMR